MRRYLGVDEVVERYAGVWSAWQIRERARLGQIPHRKHPSSNRLLFSEVDLDAFDDGAQLEVRKLSKGGRIVRPVKS